MKRQLRWGVAMLALFLTLGGIIGNAKGLFFSNHMNADAGDTGVGVLQLIPKTKSWLSTTVYALGEDHVVYEGVVSSKLKPLKDVNGNILVNIEKLYTSAMYSGGGKLSYIALASDQSVYIWGENTDGQLGDGSKTNITAPTLLNETFPSDIVDIKMGCTSTFLILKDGSVYASGKNDDGILATGDTSSSDKFIPTLLTNIQDMEISSNDYSESGIALDQNGRLYSWGKNAVTQGTTVLSPTRLKANAQGDPFDVKIKMIAQSKGSLTVAYNTHGFHFIDYNNTFYDVGDVHGIYCYDVYRYGKEGRYVTVTYPTANTYITFNPSDEITEMMGMHFSFNAVVNGKYYVKTSADSYSSALLQEKGSGSGFVQYTDDIIAEADDLLFAVEGQKVIYIIKKDHKAYVYNNAKKHEVKCMPSIQLKVTKVSDGTAYKSKEKYHDDISIQVGLDVSSYPSSTVSYKECDADGNNCGAAIDTGLAETTIQVEATKDTLVNRTYKFYVTGKESETTMAFVVDLYQKDIDVSSANINVTDGDALSVEDEIQLTLNDTTNGLVGNVVSQQIQKPNSSSFVTYDGLPLKDLGNYVYHLIDLYGNETTINFSISDKPVPKAITFVKNGTLVFGTTETQANGTLGTMSLEYDPGKLVSDVQTISITEGNDDGYFRVEVDPITHSTTLYADKEIPAGSYTIKCSGTDTNGAKFKDLSVSFDVNKAANPMTWNQATKDIIANGLTYGTAFTLGVDQLPAEMTVTYKQTSANPDVSVASNGEITVTNMSGNTMTIDVEATPQNATNYLLTPLQATITIQKQKLDLKTVIGTGQLDQATISLEDALPSFAVVPVTALPAGISLPTPASFTIYDPLTSTVITDITKAGTYEIHPEYKSGDLDAYDVTWSYAKLTVTNIVIGPGNASDFYSLTVDDGLNTTYTPGDWTKYEIKIEPKHASFTEISLDGGSSFMSGIQTYAIEGDANVSMIFKNAAGAMTQPVSVNMKYDKTSPVLTGIQYSDQPILSNGTVAFDKLFSKAQTASFTGNDTAGTQPGSGIKTYAYELQELDAHGNDIGVATTGDGLHVQASLAVNKNYRLRVIAVDEAGNESSPLIETIMIDDNIPELKPKATLSDGSAYDGTTWTNQEITVVIECDSDITEYEYSTDGINFTSLGNVNTLTIPNTSDLDVTYTFRGTTLTGLKTTKQLPVKLDITQPDILIQATSNGAILNDGDIAEHDVTLTPSNQNHNLSGTTYYYTTDSSLTASDPTLPGSKWLPVSTVVTISDNGLVTYYFKGVSGAGVVSPLASFTVDLQKKVYTAIQVEAISGGVNYQGTWTNQDVEITVKGGLKDASLIKGYEYCITNGSAPTSSDPWIPLALQGDEGVLTLQADQKDQSYWFRVDKDGMVSSAIKVNIDQTAPIMTQITYQDKTNSLLETIINQLSFNNFFKEAQTAIFEGSDGSIGSGIKEYRYTLSTLNEDGTIHTAGTQKQGKRVDLNKDTKYKLEVIAVDEAGNLSTTPLIHTITINDKVGSFDITATTVNTKVPYAGTWTSEPVLVEFSSIDAIQLYEWSTDGVTFTPITGPAEYEIDNHTSRNGEIFYFRATNNKGDQSIKTITVNIDIDVPKVSILATSKGQPITTGTIADDDITLKFGNQVNNISKEVYYYTKDAIVSTKDPRDTSSGWIKCNTDTLSILQNETSTYYVVAVSGADVVSDVASFDVNLQKKVYTKPLVQATSAGNPYINGSWTKEEVIMEITGGIDDASLITGYEYTTTSSMTPPALSATWDPVPMNGTKGVLRVNDETATTVYWFRVDASSPYMSAPMEVKLDQTKPVIEDIKLTYQNTDGISQILNMITLGAYFNQEIDAEVLTSDNFNTANEMIIEVQEIKQGVAGPWIKYTGTLHYGDGTNLTLKARVRDAAGNQSEIKESKPILLDLTSPEIQGVESGKTYHLMRYVTFTDHVSGIQDDATYYEDGGGEHPLTSPATFKGQGKVTLHVEDQAGNDTELSFEIISLPLIDDLEDTDADRALIDSIVDEYKEVKEHMSEQERKEFEEWLKNAKDKVKRYVSEIKEPSSNIIISGLENTKFDEEVELIVEIVTSEIKVQEINLKDVTGLDANTELKEAYDIYLKKGTEVIPIPENGSVKVMIPYTKERQQIQNLKVVYIDEGKQVSVYPHEIETVKGESYITFVTTHFSHYALVGDIEKGDLNKDVDGDGIADINITKPGEDRPYLNIDTDHDDRPDVNVDLDGDMVADINIDVDGDLIPDVDIISCDEASPNASSSIQNGTPEINLDVNEDGIPDKNVVKLTEWKPDFNVDQPIKYDTMCGIKYNKEDPDKSDGSSSSGDDNGGGSTGSDTSVQGNYQKNIGSANTGDETKVSMLWLMTLISGGISVYTIRKRYKKHV